MNEKIGMSYNSLQSKNFLSAICLLLTILILSALFPISAWAAIPEAPASFYAADYADILSSETESRILSESAALDDACGAQIVVVTVDFTDGMDIEDYAYKLFNRWKIGSSDRNNGLLILMVPGEENYWVMQGKGLESSLSAGTIQTILDTYMEPDFAAEDYDSAVLKSYEKFYSSVAGIYGLSAEDVAAGNYEGSRRYADDGDKYGGTDGAADRRAAGVITIISALVILFILIVIFRALFRGSARRAAGGYSARGTRRGRSMSRRNIPPMGGPGHMPPPPPGGAGPGSFGGPPPAPPRRARSSGPSSGTRAPRPPRSSRPASSSRSSSFGRTSSGGGRSAGRTGGGGSTRGGGAGRK